MTSVHGDEVSSPTLWQQIWRRKPVTVMTEETGTDTGEGELARTIGLFQLSLFGIGATIGTGIFIVLTVGGAGGRPGGHHRRSWSPASWPA